MTIPNSKTKPPPPATNKASWACQTTPDSSLANEATKTPKTSTKVTKKVLVRHQNSKVISQIKINLKVPDIILSVRCITLRRLGRQEVG